MFFARSENNNRPDHDRDASEIRPPFPSCFRHFPLLEQFSSRTTGQGYADNRSPTMGPSPPSPPSSRLVVMGALLFCLGVSSNNALVLSRGSFAAGTAAGSRIQPLPAAQRCNTCRARVTSTTSTTMALGRNSSRSRTGPGKQGRARRSGCGGTPGGADGRAGVRARANRRTSFGDSSASSSRTRGGGEPLGFFDVGDVVWGVGRREKGSPAAGMRGAGFGKYQPTRTAGGTFTARGGLYCCTAAAGRLS